MQAWLCRGYGGIDQLVLAQRPKPEPGAQDILVRIHAASVSSADMRVRTQRLPRGFGMMGRLVFGFTRPRQPVLGTDLAGTVEAVGARVTAFRPGDEVVGVAGAGMGCHAQYRVLSTRRPIVAKPPGLSFEEAVSLPFGGLAALHFLRKAKLKDGERVLVIGAAGAVGSAMVQLARHQGAVVTGVASARNFDLVASLGAQSVIDYTVHDPLAGPGLYDIVADTVGAHSFAACEHVLNEKGRYLSVAGSLADLLARPRGSKTSIGGPAEERTEDLQQLMTLAAQGVLKPVIDRVYGFDDLPQAHAHVETGRKRGAVVVSLARA